MRGRRHCTYNPENGFSDSAKSLSAISVGAVGERQYMLPSFLLIPVGSLAALIVSFSQRSFFQCAYFRVCFVVVCLLYVFLFVCTSTFSVSRIFFAALIVPDVILLYSTQRNRFPNLYDKTVTALYKTQSRKRERGRHTQARTHARTHARMHTHAHARTHARTRASDEG